MSDSDSEVASTSDASVRVVHPCHRFFLFQAGKSKCLVPGCNTILAGKNATNLSGHLSKLHGKTEEFKEYSSLLESFESQKVAKKRKKEALSTTSSPKEKQLKLDEVYALRQLIMLSNRLQCAELIEQVGPFHAALKKIRIRGP